MKMLKKLALVSAISVISAGAFAMEAMDDESMAAATGQDGITIKVIPGEFRNAGNSGANGIAAQAAIDAGYKRGVAIQQLGYASGFKGLTIGEIRVHDDDGLGVTALNQLSNSGAIVIGGGSDGASAYDKKVDSTFVFTNQATGIQIDVDSVGAVGAATAANLAAANTSLTAANTSLTAANTTLTTSNTTLATERDTAAQAAGAADYATADAAQKATADAAPAVVAAQASVVTAQIAVNDAQEDVSVKTAGVATATANASNTGAMLNVKITTPSLRIQTGAIYVANSNAAASDEGVDANGNAIAATTYDTDGTTVSGKIKILDGMGLTMGSATINVQLGSEEQGSMIKLNTAITGGLTIDKIGLIDAGGAAAPALGQPVTTGGKIYIGQMKINDNGGSDLTVKVNVDVGSRNTSTFTTGNRDAIVADATGGLIATNAGLNGFTAQAQATRRDTIAGGLFGTTYALATADQKAQIDATDTQLAGLDATITSKQAVIQEGFNGLVINLEQVGGANGMDIAMNDLRLGDSNAKTMGDVQILGLNISGTNVVIMGH